MLCNAVPVPILNSLALAILLSVTSLLPAAPSHAQSEPVSEPITLRFLDPDGVAVRDVTATPQARYSSWIDDWYMRPLENIGYDQAPDGRILLTPNFRAADTYTLCLWQRDRDLVAFIDLTPAMLGSEQTVQLRAACRVTGRLACTDLPPGQRMRLTNTYVRSGAALPIESMSVEETFVLQVPPGTHTFLFKGTGAVEQELEVEIPPGQSQLDLGTIPLPGDGLTRLIGHPAPPLDSLRDWSTGQPVSLEDYRGHYVLLTFWGAEWRRYSQREIGALFRFHEAFGSRSRLQEMLGRPNLKVIGIGALEDPVTDHENLAELDRVRSQYLGEDPFPFVVALDGGDPTPVPGAAPSIPGATAAAWGINETPTRVLVGPDGTVLQRVFTEAFRGNGLLNAFARIDPLVGPRADSELAWQENFHNLYRLEEDEVLKFIPAPYIPERESYYKTEEFNDWAGRWSLPERLVFSWNGTLKKWGSGFGRQTGLPLRMLGIPNYAFPRPIP